MRKLRDALQRFWWPSRAASCCMCPALTDRFTARAGNGLLWVVPLLHWGVTKFIKSKRDVFGVGAQAHFLRAAFALAVDEIFFFAVAFSGFLGVVVDIPPMTTVRIC